MRRPRPECIDDEGEEALIRFPKAGFAKPFSQPTDGRRSIYPPHLFADQTLPFDTFSPISHSTQTFLPTQVKNPIHRRRSSLQSRVEGASVHCHKGKGKKLLSSIQFEMPVQRRGMRALLIWCQRVTADYAPKVRVEDLTGSFRDGMAFCAIIHHFRPDLIGDFDALDPADVVANNTLAYSVAEDKLGIPALLDAEDMAEEVEPDKFSVVTYLSQFYHLFKDADGGHAVRGDSEKILTASLLSSDNSSEENDSLLDASSSPEVNTPVGTPKVAKAPPPKLFNHAELLAKYGEEIFSVSKEEKDDERQGRREEVPEIHTPPVRPKAAFGAISKSVEARRALFEQRASSS